MAATAPLTPEGRWTAAVMALAGPRQPNIERVPRGFYGSVDTPRAGFLFVGPLRDTREAAADDVLTWLARHPWTA